MNRILYPPSICAGNADRPCHNNNDNNRKRTEKYLLAIIAELPNNGAQNVSSLARVLKRV